MAAPLSRADPFDEESGAVPRLPVPAILLYSLPAAGSGFMGGLISLYLLKFSTDVLLIAPGVMGLLFGVSRVWDAVSDPLAGYWSDRTSTGLGRRRPWILASALPVGLAFICLWAPPGVLEGVWLTLWMGAAVILFYSASTALSVPHTALGAELTTDHHDRTRVFAGRMLIDVLGTLLAAGGLYLFEHSEDVRLTAAQISWAAAVLTAALAIITVAGVREPREHRGRGGDSPYGAFGDVLRNPHARLLLMVILLETLGFSAMVTTMPYATEYWFDLPGKAGILVGSAVVMMIVSVPFWPVLSRRFGKRNVWITTMVMRSVAFLGLFLAAPGQLLPILVGVILIGSAFGGGSVLGPSIKADVIDWDEARTGQRKEGAYFAAWNLSLKLGGGLAIGMTGLALQLGGFEANVQQSDQTILVIRALYAGLPCVFYALAAVLLARFSLDERAHAEVREAIAQRRDSA
jgi:GPH family glycoside/pentoside/hexuronide:cation symporter